MNRLFLIACMPAFLVTTTLAQAPKLPPELAALPDEIKRLPWQTIDMSSIQPLEHCRALLLLNHTLDALSDNATAEADLMSAYIEKNNLGTQFASTPPPPTPRGLMYPDAEKVAIALLRGPMSGSSYATELSDLGGGGLSSYEQMYSRTCTRRWSEFDEARHQVRAMSSFLGKTNKLQDYNTWATAESLRREQAAQQRAATAAAAAQAQANATASNVEAQRRKQQLELMEVNAALTSAQSQQQQPQQQSSQAPDNSGNQTMTPGGQPAQAVPGGYLVDTGDSYYGGYGGYGYAPGVAAVGVGVGVGVPAGNGVAAAQAGAYANAAAASRDQMAAVNGNQYHGASSTWNREPSYSSNAMAQTEARMSSFHAAGGRR